MNATTPRHLLPSLFMLLGSFALGCSKPSTESGAAPDREAPPPPAVSPPAREAPSPSAEAPSEPPAGLRGFEGQLSLKTTNAQGSQEMTMLAKGDKLRFDMKTRDGKASHGVYDPAKNRVTLVLDSDKTFMDMNFAAPSAPKPNTDPTTSTASKTGKTGKVAGLPCEEWVVRDPSGKRSEACIAQGIAFFDLNALKAGGGPSSGLAKQFRENRSFPLRSIEFDASGKEVSRMEVVRIERRPVPDSDFAVPADYRRVELPHAR